MTNQEAKEAGHGQGFGDACDWIADLSVREINTDERLSKSLRTALQSQSDADEGLINALTASELDEQMGFSARTPDGSWTPAASAWLAGYNAGWRSAVEDRLAKLEARAS